MNIFTKLKESKGFTLIELLIVVAIIAILAAIAVPNFLEAQVRAKVSRARADMRSIATALESYAVDNNGYPYNQRRNNIYFSLLPYVLTSPVAYLSGPEVMNDVFKPNAPAPSFTQTGSTDPNFNKRYNYFNTRQFFELTRTQNVTLVYLTTQLRFIPRDYAQNGQWTLASFGPDLQYGPEFLPPNSNTNLLVIYDPTNGTVSPGDVVRTQRDPLGEGVDRP